MPGTKSLSEPCCEGSQQAEESNTEAANLTIYELWLESALVNVLVWNCIFCDFEKFLTHQGDSSPASAKGFNEREEKEAKAIVQSVHHQVEKETCWGGLCLASILKH